MYIICYRQELVEDVSDVKEIQQKKSKSSNQPENHSDKILKDLEFILVNGFDVLHFINGRIYSEFKKIF